MNVTLAHESVTRCFTLGESIALLVGNHSQSKVTRWIVKTEGAATPPQRNA
jgi:hypothetical protein